MSFWDELKQTAQDAYDAKRTEVSGFLGDTISGMIKGAATPTKQSPNQTIQPAAPAAAIPSYAMYALPAAIVIGALIMFRRK